MKSNHITVTDLFCGAGGSSQGVRNLSNKMKGGIEVTLAMNHWKLAIETHNTNFPDTLHDCTDISACDPRRYPSTQIAIMSPECTTHSPAGGNNHKALKKQMDMFNNNKVDPATERSRATMWDVCRFAEYHDYNAIIVENVVEAKTRWPLFDAWLNAMHILGYSHKCVYLNSMHCHPTPQSRDRMYIVFWKSGNKAPDLEHRPEAWCPCCEKNILAIQVWKNVDKKFGKYRQQYLYRCPKDGVIVEPYYHAALNIIDWSDLGTRIGDRVKPLCPNTQKRVKAGLDKFSPEPYIIHAAYGDHARGVVRSIKDPAFTQATSLSQAIINPPFFVDDKHSTGIDFRVRTADKTISTIHTDPRVKLITPPPFIIKGEHTSANNLRSVTDVLQTQTATESMGLLTPPFITTNRGKSLAHSSTDPLTTQSSNINHGIITSEAMKSFIAYHNNGVQVSHISEACDTQATNERMSLVNYKTPNMEDCFYRMLNKNEIKLAMAFDRDYIIMGSGKDQVKQCGNAVTPPVMEWLVGQVVQSLW